MLSTYLKSLSAFGPGLSHRAACILIIACCLLSRLPQLLSPNLLLDGDECVVAMMARHMSAGTDFPLYFYGQKYGFALIECLFIMLFSAGGITALTVKAGMLALWATGVLFFYGTLTRLTSGDRRIAMLLTLILVFHPAWAEWSMKARGGYLTAFTLSNITLWLLSATHKKGIVFLCAGALCYIIYESQPLFLPGLLPLVLFLLFRNRSVVPVLLFIAPAICLAFPAHLYKQGLHEAFVAPFSFSAAQAQRYFVHLPASLYHSLHGNHYFEQVQNPDFFCAFSAIIFEVAVAGLLIAGLVFLPRHRKGAALFLVAVACVACTLVAPVVSNFAPRYFLPVVVSAVIALSLLPQVWPGCYKALHKIVAIPLTIGALAVVLFWNFRFVSFTGSQLQEVVGFLVKNNVRYVYCADNLIAWQLQFYGNGQLTTHERFSPGRYPAHPRAVDSAFVAGAPVAFVTTSITYPEVTAPNSHFIGNCKITIGPSMEDIKRLFEVR